MNSWSGMHSLCVCEIHQNFKLSNTILSCDYKELLALKVCNIENRDCMLHLCDDCPAKNGILR